jgi:glycosyltransferase involved in cell wall biosynthesis
MSLPRISIITPVRNGLPYIKECIESVLAQSFQDWELLISDNDSNDGTQEYLDAQRDPRIRVFKQTKNIGILGNVNFLLRQIRGEFCQILCADDFFVNTSSLSEIVDYWVRAPLTIGFARFNHLDGIGTQSRMLERKLTPAVVTPDMSDLWFFVFGNFPGNLSDTSFRSSLPASIGNFDEDLPYAGDFDFWCRASRKFAMGVEKKSVVHVRRHPKVASIYMNLKGELYPQHIYIYQNLLERLSVQYNRHDLIMYFNFTIAAQHYRKALKFAMKGKFSYLKTFVESRSKMDLPKWYQLVVCLPFALFNAEHRLTVNMARRIVMKRKSELLNQSSTVNAV